MAAVKRLSKAERAAAADEAALAEARRLAGLLASAAAEGGAALAPPAFISDPRLEAALVVWRELAPQLEKTGRLHRLDRFMFAMLCYWQAEWITAHADILARGYWFMKKAVAGGERPWTNPSVNRRDRAAAEIAALSAKFGLTPIDRAALGKGQRDGLLDDPDLFRPAAPAPSPAAADAPPSDKWGALLGDDKPTHLN